MNKPKLHIQAIRPTVMDVALDALEYNYRQIKQLVAPAQVMGVVKANAYGHGIVPCARRLEKAGIDSLGVALVDEGIELRDAGIETPILVLGGILGEEISYFLDYDLELTASSIDKLVAVEETAKQMGKIARVHLKIDTGMGRIGVSSDRAAGLIDKSLECEHCEVVGIYSHFATSPNPDTALMETQLSRFETACARYEELGLPMPTRHMADSAAIIQSKATHLDLVRPGICLYGAYPVTRMQGQLDLKPVMTLRSQVVYFKVVEKGWGVSYGHTWVADKDSRVVTIPIGYADGYDRSLSNKGSVLIRGQRYPIVGNICMDQLMVDIDGDEAYNGDEVVLIGQQGDQEITVNEIADLSGTVAHDVVTTLTLRVPRRYN